MDKTSPPIQTHLGNTNSPHIDDLCEIVEVDNDHRYELRCVDCNQHISWASELDYLWLNWNTGSYNKRLVKLKTLHWAAHHDHKYQELQTALRLEKLKRLKKEAVWLETNKVKSKLINPREEWGI